ncbi:MAG: methylated-DNA--[protein]-cysteine S-methyltransferase [Dehalococcoidia bacterium]
MMRYCLFPTPLGWMGLLGSEAGIRRVILPKPSPQDVLRLLSHSLRGAKEDASPFGDLPQRLSRYLEGERVSLADPLDLEGTTPFQQEVWAQTRLIPPGQTRSYGWVARRMGRPRAVRAVGGALARNPVPLLIPCHRVVRSDGGLGGYGGGLEMKRRLLQIEGSV